MHAPQRKHRVEVAGRALAVAERDGTHDPATGRALTGSWLWDSALVLASHLAASDHANPILRGATVVELGAGATGLPGIAAVSCLGARRCVLTDAAPALLPGLRANADANGLDAAQADVRELRWGDDLPADRGGLVGQVDVVLMSDVFYDPEEMPALAKTMQALWHWREEEDDGGSIADTVGWAASEARDGVEECVGVLRKEGFEVAEVERVTRPLLRERDPDAGKDAEFVVYRLQLRRPPRGG
ncbi:uncharacterized protein LOC100831692 [Brachypodium distachyon]|uniref:Methyltransferase small domain-containing protein n=1 Tax=Brachypodium distachyon TaxID=15368 RepID=I1J2K1_BRADI|nr:uncharacterized protein LOC100831692 [Brachypodium distachyon]KQJ84952.1 hypothetical protein BRADI_5g23900v3 [Brachypodium distachyon]|eukprot:XP_003579383.1 uncharacterized protein LOC100831692 [Brachypodium distachyon]